MTGSFILPLRRRALTPWVWALRATGRGRPVGRLKLLRSYGLCFAPQTPGAHSVGLAYAPWGAVARSGS